MTARKQDFSSMGVDRELFARAFFLIRLLIGRGHKQGD